MKMSSSTSSGPRRLRAPHSRVPMDCGPGVDPIWAMIDACGNLRYGRPRKGLVYREGDCLLFGQDVSGAPGEENVLQTHCRVCMISMPQVPCERPQNSSNMMGREWTLTRYSRCLLCCHFLCPRPNRIGGIGHDPTASSECPTC